MVSTRPTTNLACSTGHTDKENSPHMLLNSNCDACHSPPNLCAKDHSLSVASREQYASVEGH